jgi:Na+-transporting NADH:ubiquinone oxidoreductase subunit NqrD
MDKVMINAPLALQILGICLLWLLKATWIAVAIVMVIAWNLFRVVLTGFMFGRLPRSYIRVFD